MKQDIRTHEKSSLAAFVKSTDLFKQLDEDILREFSEDLELVDLKKGDTLFRQGDHGNDMYIVMRGRLEVSIIKKNFAETVVGYVEPGMPVGEMQILAGAKRSATVYAVQDTELVKIPKSTFQRIVSRFPEVLHHIAHIIRERLRHNQLFIILSHFLGSSDEETLRAIENRGEWIHLHQNQLLFRQGEQGDGFYILISGRLRIVVEDQNGIEQSIGVAVPGECVGEMAALTQETRSAGIYATRESYLIKYSNTNFNALIAQYPQMLMQVSNIVINRLRHTITSREQIHTVKNVAVIPAGRDCDTSDFTAQLVSAVSHLKPTLHLNSRKMESLLGMPGISQVSEHDPDDVGISTWLDEQETKYQIIIYETDMMPSYWTQRCLHRADDILIVGRAGSSPEPGDIEKVLLDESIGVPESRRGLILLYDESDRTPSGTKQWLDRRRVECHFHICRNKKSDFQRLARCMTGNAIGLVLGGGGARGLAHIGVIHALQEAGIPIDMIGGTSIGAVIAAQYAIGLSYDEIIHVNKRVLREIKPFRQYTLPLLSILKSGRINEACRMVFGDTNIEDLWTNYFCISCNLSTAEMVIHREGSLWKAIRASSSLPGVFEPVVYEKNLFIDGGVLNNLPGDIMKSLCRGYVIAVNASSEEDLTIECDEIPSPWKIILGKILPFWKPINIPNISDVIMRATVVGSLHQSKMMKADADLYLHPPIDDFGLLEFSQMDNIIDAGYHYTKAVISEMKPQWLFPRESYI
ncbi:MAG: cyclic nucleotide-binding and patatin-like phospholipase domain-containing protein [Deltaproteobacteria bacterium]|nr:cyclic nucleotide-binding and patatin-like phospholipase domain-containing protein [Deltaproteobacteria bacterium]